MNFFVYYLFAIFDSSQVFHAWKERIEKGNC